MKCWAEVEKKSQEIIQEVRTNEANPWLERAGWSKYLKELNRPELLASIREPEDGDPDVEASIREPNSNPGAEEEEEKEPVEAVIWKAVGDVAEIQRSKRIGYKRIQRISLSFYIRLNIRLYPPHFSWISTFSLSPSESWSFYNILVCILDP